MASVKVAVRVRPFNDRELNMDAKCIIKMDKNTTTIINNKISDTSNSLISELGSSAREKYKTFSYDYSYWSFNLHDDNFASQDQVFNDLGKNVVNCAFEGYNACVFAYGQTGSGKSFSMMGQPGTINEGLIPKICRALFDRIKNDGDRGHNFRTEVSYLEIYNEKVRDLLRVSSKLQQNLKVREHPQEGPYVEDLSKHIVVNYDDIEEIMNRGNINRTTASTNMNDVSSRSHAIFTIKFVQAKVIGNMPSETVSKIHLVDLAGSERADSTGAIGIRLKEGGNINKSLLTLINVISTLADSASDNRKFYIPYRDSILTWLLKDSLGGNSKTVMLATISPADINYAETLSTLRYANRAKSIINKPTINEDYNVKLIRELRLEIQRLEAIIEKNSYDKTINELDMRVNEEIDAKLIERKDSLKYLTHKWQCKWKKFHEIFDQIEMTTDDETVNGNKFDIERNENGAIQLYSKNQPYLIGFDDNILKCGLSYYALKLGKTLMGTEMNADVILNCVDEDENCVQVEHCLLINDNNQKVTLCPLNNAKCIVNGMEVTKNEIDLETGSLILIGKTNMFRFNNPYQIEMFKQNGLKVSNSLISFNSAFSTPTTSSLSTSQLKECNCSQKLKLLEDTYKHDCDRFLLLQNEYELKLVEQRKQIEQLYNQVNWSNKEICKLNNITKLKEIELIKKNEIFENEKVEFMLEREKFEEQKLLMDCIRNLNDKQMNSLKLLFSQLQDIKCIDTQLVAQIKKEKFIIEKEIHALNEQREMNILSINELRDEKLNKNKELSEIKLEISNLSEHERNLKIEILNKKQKIQQETNDLDIINTCFNNKKLNFLKQENLTYENAILYENEAIDKELEKLNKFKFEKQSLYQLIETDIENQRVKMDKELIDLKLSLQNEKASLLSRDNDLKMILHNRLYQNSEEKAIIESEIMQNFNERLKLDAKFDDLKLKEEQYRLAILNEYNGLEEVKNHDLIEIKNEEERFNYLVENSLNNLSNTIKVKSNDIDFKKDELKQLFDQLNESNQKLSEMLEKLEKCEASRMSEENEIFQSELKFNNDYKEKVAHYNNQLINIERNYQAKLDENFTRKENVKQKICSIIGEQKGIRLLYTDLNDKLQEIEQKFNEIRQNLNKVDEQPVVARLNQLTHPSSNSYQKIEYNKANAEKLYLSEINRQRTTSTNSSVFNAPLTQQSYPLLSNMMFQPTNDTDDTKITLNVAIINNQQNIYQQMNSYSDYSNNDTARSTPSIQTTSIKPSVIYRLGIELDITDYFLSTSKTSSSFNKWDEHYVFEISIKIYQEKWFIYRRYSLFRDLHTKMCASYPILKRLAFPIRKLIFFNRNEKFLKERQLQLEHYLRCFLELLINDPTCELSDYALIQNDEPFNDHNVIDDENRLTKSKLCKFCTFFQQNELDLIYLNKQSLIKYNRNISRSNSISQTSQHNGEFIY